MKKHAFSLTIAIALSAVAPQAGLADRVLSPEVSGSQSEALAVFEIGVRVGIVEQGTLEGAAPDSLVPHLVKIRELAAKIGGDESPAGELEALIEAMESATESADLHGRIVDFRKAFAARIARGEPVVAAESFDCDRGSWEGVWETTWGDMTLVFEEDGKFHGTYGPSQHAVSGVFDPDDPKVLRGRWNHFGSASTGGIRFEMKAPNRFEGGWSSEIPVVGAGHGWSGTRRKTHHSEIFIVPIGEATIAEARRSEITTWSQRFLVKKGFSVRGHPADFPFLQVYTRSPETGEWEKSGPRHRDTGIEKIPAGGTFRIDLSLPEEIARRKIVVEFGREAFLEKDDERFITLRARPLRLVPPQARGTESVLPEAEAPPGEGEEAASAEGKGAEPP